MAVDLTELVGITRSLMTEYGVQLRDTVDLPGQLDIRLSIEPGQSGARFEAFRQPLDGYNSIGWREMSMIVADGYDWNTNKPTRLDAGIHEIVHLLQHTDMKLEAAYRLLPDCPGGFDEYSTQCQEVEAFYIQSRYIQRHDSSLILNRFGALGGQAYLDMLDNNYPAELPSERWPEFIRHFVKIII